MVNNTGAHGEHLWQDFGHATGPSRSKLPAAAGWEFITYLWATTASMKSYDPTFSAFLLKHPLPWNIWNDQSLETGNVRVFGCAFFRETNLGHHWKFTAITSLRIFWDHLRPARFSANLPVTGCIRSLFLKRRQGKNASINHGEPKSCPWASKFPSSGLAPLYKQ